MKPKLRRLLRDVHTAEEALWMFLHLENGGEQVRSLDGIASKEVCAKCGGGPRTTRGRARTAICMTCEQAWDGRLVALVTPKAPRRQPFGEQNPENALVKPKSSKRVRVHRLEPFQLEHSADLLLVLREVVAARPRDLGDVEWLFDLRAFAVKTTGDGRSDFDAAALGAELFASYECDTRWWSERKVRDAVAEARAIIERRLERARRYGRLNGG
jgi:hypothetical protein